MYKIGLTTQKDYESMVNSEVPQGWRSTTVIKILDRYEYCGHTVSNRHTTRSYKSKKKIATPQDEWIVTRDTQEPIVSEETWQTAHQMRMAGRRSRQDRDKGSLNRHLFCRDCGSKMYFRYMPKLKYRPGYYLCGKYSLYHACSIHYIRMHSIEQTVLSKIQECCEMVQRDEKAFLVKLRKELSTQDDTARKNNERELRDAQNRLTNIDRIIEKLYEDRVTGTLSTERFAQMLARYEDEQRELRAKCDTLRQTVIAAKSEEENAEKFICLIRSISQPQELTPELVGNLIDRVEVGGVQEEDSVKKQDVKIIFNFIGVID